MRLVFLLVFANAACLQCSRGLGNLEVYLIQIIQIEWYPDKVVNDRKDANAIHYFLQTIHHSLHCANFTIYTDPEPQE